MRCFYKSELVCIKGVIRFLIGSDIDAMSRHAVGIYTVANSSFVFIGS